MSRTVALAAVVPLALVALLCAAVGCTERVTVAAPSDLSGGDGPASDSDARSPGDGAVSDSDGGQCTSACSDPTRPVCDSASNTCRGCRDHDECASGLCASDGRCPSPSDVAHTANCSGSGDGSRAKPFCSPAAAIGSGRPFVRLAPGTYRIGEIGRSLRIYGSPGTILDRGTDCPAIKVKGATNISVEVVGLEARGQVLVDEGASIALRQLVIGPSTCTGIEAKKNTHVVVERCLVSGHSNGGLDFEDVSDYVVTNTYFVKNGARNSRSLYLEARGTPAVFANNTIADNDGGVTCSGGGALLLNSIIWNNQGTALSVGCTASHCDVQGGAVAGPANISVDPALVGSGAGVASYRLTAGSPCVNAGAQSGDTPALDYDGDARSAPDIGADELP